MFDFSFLKVGSSPSTTSSSKARATDGSWRQAIFKRVMTPSANKSGQQYQEPQSDEEKRERKMRSKEELKEMWKRAIHQAILLVRMEKENAKIKGGCESFTIVYLCCVFEHCIYVIVVRFPLKKITAKPLKYVRFLSGVLKTITYLSLQCKRTSPPLYFDCSETRRECSETNQAGI